MNLRPSNWPTSISRINWNLSRKGRETIDMLAIAPKGVPAVSKNWDSGWVFELRSWDMKAWQSESQMQWIASVSTVCNVETVAPWHNLWVFLKCLYFEFECLYELQIVRLSKHIMAHWSTADFVPRLDAWILGPSLSWVMRLECQGGAALKRCELGMKGPKEAEMSGNLWHWAWLCLPLKGTRS